MIARLRWLTVRDEILNHIAGKSFHAKELKDYVIAAAIAGDQARKEFDGTIQEKG